MTSLREQCAPPTTPRRRDVLLSGLGLGASGLALSGCSGATDSPVRPAASSASLREGRSIARGFRGPRQAGIVEPPQAYAVFLGLDLAPGADADSLRRLLTIWTDDIERLMSGRATLADLEPELAGVPAGLTVTLGVGPRAVRVAGAQPPDWLMPLPAYPIDRLESRWSGGDLFVQICANSPTTVAHAQRRMLTNMGSLATLRWVQKGFREPFEGSDVPMRNLLGQVDGTVQPEVTGAEAHLLWGGADAPGWLRGGSSVVIRRISMNLDLWDQADRAFRERSIGRHLTSGAPLTSPADAAPTAAADLAKVDAVGLPVIDDSAHMRRARFTAPLEKILRDRKSVV